MPNNTSPSLKHDGQRYGVSPTNTLMFGTYNGTYDVRVHQYQVMYVRYTVHDRTP